MPSNTDSERGEIFQVIRTIGSLSRTPQERIIYLPCKHPGGERKSKGRAVNYRQRLYMTAKWMQTHGSKDDQLLAAEFRSNWKLTLDPDTSNSFWYVVLTPASLDPDQQIMREMLESLRQQLGTNTRSLEEEDWSKYEPAEGQVDTNMGDSNQLFRSLYGLDNAPKQEEASAPTPDPTTLSDAELRAEIDAYLATDSAIPPELDAEMKRRGA